MNRRLAAAVLSISMITILGSTAISPALAGIKQAFPMYPDETIQLLLTIPPLFIIPFCFLCGPLSEKLGKKRTLMIGLFFYLLGGVGAAAMPNFPMLLAARAVLGIGCGLITPMAQALISANFTGKVRERLTGYSSSASYMMGIIASFLVSRIALVNWRRAFLIYLIAFAVMYLNGRYLPEDRNRQMEETKQEGRQRLFVKPNWQAYGAVGLMILVNIAFYTFSTSIALFMKQERLGDDAVSGYAVAMFMIFGFVMGIAVPVIRFWMKGFTPVLGCVMMGGGYAGLSLSYSLIPILLSSALIGGSYSIFYSQIFLKIGSLSRNQEENVRFVTYTTAGIFIGQTISVHVLKLAEILLGQQGYRFRFSFLSTGLMATAVIIVGLECYTRRSMVKRI